MPSSKTSITHWTILFLACMLMFGNYYCYDIPAALNVPLQKWIESDYELYQWQINLLYSVYSFPNIIMPLIGGYLIDRLGPSLMLLLFSGCVCMGQTLFSFGVLSKSFPVMIIGRSLFGVGGESLEVAQSLITTDWFKGRGLAFALSINLSFARIATALNDIASPWIENQSSVPVAVFTGFIVCVISFVSGITIILMDRPVSRLKAGVHVDDAVLEKLKAQGKLPEEYHRLLHPNREEVALEEDEICFNEGQGCDDEAQTGSIVHDFDHIVVATTSPIPKRVRYDCKATNIDSNYESTSSSSVPIVKIEPSSPISATNDNSNPASNSPSSQMQAGAVEDESSLTTAFEEEDYEEGDETVHVEQINGLSARFWILCLITISLYGSAVPFFHICTDFFQKKWYPGDSQTAGVIMSIPDIISAIGSPICGLLVDKYGKRASLLPISALLVFITHFLMCFTTITPYFTMSILGVAYSVFPSALWPCVPYLVGRHQIATAYGLVTVSLNMALFSFPFAVAHIRSTWPEDFVPVELFFMGMSLVGLSFSLVLYALDRRQGRVLDMPSAEIAAAASAIKAETLFEGGGGRPSATERESERLLPPDADTASFLSFTSSSGAGVATDGHNEIYDNDEDLVPKVVADGHVILAPATYIHHHHHHHTAVNNTSPIASHDSIHSAGASSSTSGSQNCLGSAGSSSRGRQSSAVTCSCYINNGGLEPNEQGNFCKTHRRTDHASKSRRRPSSSSSRSRSRGRI